MELPDEKTITLPNGQVIKVSANGGGNPQQFQMQSPSLNDPTAKKEGKDQPHRKRGDGERAGRSAVKKDSTINK
jgi:hypothetical protein